MTQYVKTYTAHYNGDCLLGVFCTSIYPSMDVVMTCTDGFSHGSVCSFACSHSKELHGPSTAECTKLNGSPFPEWPWSDAGFPNCQSK